MSITQHQRDTISRALNSSSRLVNGNALHEIDVAAERYKRISTNHLREMLDRAYDQLRLEGIEVRKLSDRVSEMKSDQ